MFTEPLAIKPTSEATWNFYKLQGASTKQSDWAEDSNDSSTQITARIQHSKQLKAKSNPAYSTKRHNITFALEKVNADASSRKELATVSVTVSYADTGLITRAMIDELLYASRDFTGHASLGAGRVDKWLRGEG